MELQRIFRNPFFLKVPVGDVVEITGEYVKVLKEEINKLRKEIEDLMNDVWED